MGQGARLRPWPKRVAFNLLMLFGTWGMIEGLSLVATLLLVGSPALLDAKRRMVAEQEPFKPGGFLAVPTVIHPYIGAVMQPADDGGQLSIDNKYRINEFGFIDDSLPVHKRSPDQIIVGILGGSVARQFSLNATETLADELKRSPDFAGKKFQFVRLAGNGYKQPQQLMIVNYLLTLGAEFDILINLDGVNEAVLPGVDNVPFGVFSAYPRDWGQMVAGTASPEFNRMGGYIAYLRLQQRDDARRFGLFPWNYSPTAQAVWAFRKERSDQSMLRAQAAMHKFTKREQTYCASGPPEHFDSEEEMYRHCAAIWSRSSIQLHHVCAGQGIRFFHFLQPNQYVKGSKPIGDEEAGIAIREGSQMCVGVRQCFPLMQAQVPHMIDSGVRFTDLTLVFTNHPEPIYNDTCCHLFEAGDIIMARAIASTIVQDGNRKERSPISRDQ